jgi:hypothetical protein
MGYLEPIKFGLQQPLHDGSFEFRKDAFGTERIFPSAHCAKG